MTYTYGALEIEKCVPLRNKAYYYFLLDRIRKAKKRIWVVMFIINIKRAEDPHGEIRELLNELHYALLRGVDVRIISSRGTKNMAIYEINHISRLYLHARRINVQSFADDTHSYTHSKYVIFDDNMFVIGSHNWSDNAINKSQEDSIAVFSLDMTYQISKEFSEMWYANFKKGSRR